MTKLHTAKLPLTSRNQARKGKASHAAQPAVDGDGAGLVDAAAVDRGSGDGRVAANGPSTAAAGQSEAGSAGAGSATGAGANSHADHGGHDAGGSMTWAYVLGGAALVGGGVAAAAGGGGGGGASTPTTVAPPSLALASDTGSSTTDGVTRSGVINVSGLVSGATWQYSTNSGAAWTAGSGTSFVLADGSYASGAVQVRQTSGGVVSAAAPLAQALTIDGAILAPTIAMVSGDDVIRPDEAVGGISVNGTAEANATVTLTWTSTGRTATATVTADGNGAWTYRFGAGQVPDATTAQSTTLSVVATDKAGNVSATVTRAVATDPGVTVSGVVTAGAAIADNGLSVNLYDGSGTLLVAGVKVGADGRYSVAHVPLKSGDVVVATIVDAGNGADYLDEATGLPVDLAGSLLAVTTVGNGAVTLAINPLTTLAARTAGLAVNGAGLVSGTASASGATAANAAVASAFGLDAANLTGLAPEVVPVGGYASGATLTSAQQAGVILAAISGMDLDRGTTLQATLDSLVAALTVTGATGALSAAALTALMDGSDAARASLGTTSSGYLAGLLAKGGSTASGFAIDVVAGDDLITANEAGSITLRGTVPAGATAVTITLREAHQAVVSGDTWSLTVAASEISGVVDGAAMISAAATLADGTVVQAVRPVLIHATAPQIPVITAIAGDGLVNAAERAAGIAVTGTADAGATVKIIWAGATLQTVAGTDGVWRIDVPAAKVPGDGVTTLSVSASDAYGNASATASAPVTVDSAIPAAPTIAVVAGDDRIGALEAQGALALSGTAEARAAVAVSWGGHRYQATADGQGHWTVSVPAAEIPADGASAIQAMQVDQAGNASAAVSRTVSVQRFISAITVDPVASDNTVNFLEAQSGVIVSGAAPADASLELTWGATSRTVTVDGNGNWSVTFGLADLPVDGDSEMRVSGVDAAGNELAEVLVSPAIQIDTQAPSVTLDTVAGDNAINVAEATAGVVVTGVAEAGAKVAVTLGGQTREVTAGTDGQWTLRYAKADLPADGTTTIAVRATDLAGNSGALVSRALVIAATAPATPRLALGQDTGTSATDQVTSNGLVAVTGLLSGASWEYTLDNGKTWNEGTGSSFTLDPQDYAANAIRVRQTDSVGNLSAEGVIAGGVVVRTSGPAIEIEDVADDGKINAAERAAGVTVKGQINDYSTAVPVTVTVRWGNGTAKTAQVATDGSWSASFATDELPGNGSATLNVLAVDAAGNSQTAQANVQVLTTLPGQPSLALLDDTGASTSDGITNKNKLQIGGIASGNGWQVSTDGGATWGDSDSGPTVDLKDGSYAAGQLLVRQVDVAGNAGPSVALTRAITIDTSVSVAQINTVGTNNLVNAPMVAAGVEVTGKAEAGASVAVSWGTTTTLTTTADAQGVWSVRFTAGQVPADGDTVLSAVVTDLAGNVSEKTDQAIRIDTAPPAPPEVNTVAGNNVVSAAEKLAGVTVTGTGLAGASVAVNWGSSTRTAIADASGVWSVSFASDAVPADSAATTISVRQTNASGNSSTAVTKAVQIDTTVTEPVIQAVAGDDRVNIGERDAGVAVSGTAEAGAVVRLTWGTATVATTADASGNWTASFAGWQVPASGATTLSAQAVDSAGNASAVTTRAITVDTVRPDATSIDAISGDNIVTATEFASAVTVGGKAEANAVVIVQWGNATKAVTASASGVWSAQFSQSELGVSGDSTVLAQVRDSAGNLSQTASRAVLVGAAVGAVPVIAPIAVDNQINATEKSAGVRISGLATAGSTVQLAFAGGGSATAIADSTGAWTASFTKDGITVNGITTNQLPADGLATLTATVNGQSATRSVMIDSQSPAAPTVAAVTGDDLVSATDAAAGVAVHGTSEAGATVKLTWGTANRTVQADAQGNWNTTFAGHELPADGQSAIVATATDAVGNGGASTQHAVTVATVQTGTATADVITAAGSGASLAGLGGDDLLILADLAFRSIDGGTGSNTVQFGSAVHGATLDLTQLANGRLSNVQTIDIANGANHLVVGQGAILADTGADGRLIVTGGASDTVTASGFIQTGTASANGHQYTVYASGSATLWVDQLVGHVVL